MPVASIASAFTTSLSETGWITPQNAGDSRQEGGREIRSTWGNWNMNDMALASIVTDTVEGVRRGEEGASEAKIFNIENQHG